MEEIFKPLIRKLKSSNLRPTKQRLLICKILFSDTKKTIHFTAEDLKNKIEIKYNQKVSLATVYNTIHSLTKAGFLKQVGTISNKNYFDTNVSDHHHFYDEERKELIDINNLKFFDYPVLPRGKKIKGIDVTIKIENDNQNQK